ncbi:MAG: hypothetical protein F9K13_00320 [Candidatus Methylomirabilis oxygeniifera]|uniref:Putative mxaA protein, involved in Ca2+ insertion in methanol dehydrogenase n=1 Tax=Methylomirabilis oxygeniifera TaxID=671143 RepID=D5MI84_METO1|nr:MAG: hypothetical protein F9K13_00320 [Candidatus Methylomirabilis oxyfera]CBE67234.1 Putative mxaA protein, involved in Ca2+ insertion in methanol dehydrogenase [Candidatus Methylomirabilis oxyfera]
MIKVPFVILLFSPMLMLALPFTSVAHSDPSPQNGPIVRLEFDTFHPFGIMIGDIVTHTARIEVRQPFQLQRSSLPIKGPLARWLDLRDLTVHEQRTGADILYSLSVSYQVFRGVMEVRPLAIPPIPLRFQAGNETITFSIPEWRFTASPILPILLGRTDRGIRPLPERKPEELDLTAYSIRLSALAVGSGLSLLTLAYSLGMASFLPRGRGPFARCLKHLKRLHRTDADPEQYREAFRCLHRALNEANGRVLFIEGLREFTERHPAFKGLRDEIEIFFAHSRQLFFDVHPQAAAGRYPLSRLITLCRLCRDAERGIW